MRKSIERTEFVHDFVKRAQGKPGLGIEAQRAALARFAEAEGFEIGAPVRCGLPLK